MVRGGPKGHYVPPEMLLGHDAVANFEKARPGMDEWEVYDNEGTAAVIDVPLAAGAERCGKSGASSTKPKYRAASIS